MEEKEEREMSLFTDYPYLTITLIILVLLPIIALWFINLYVKFEARRKHKFYRRVKRDNWFRRWLKRIYYQINWEEFQDLIYSRKTRSMARRKTPKPNRRN